MVAALSEGVVLGIFGLVGVCVTSVASVVAAVLAGRTRADAKELRNNGGSSLRDAVDRIETKVTGVEATAEAALQVSEANHAQIVQLRDEVGGLDRTVKGHDDKLRGRA